MPREARVEIFTVADFWAREQRSGVGGPRHADHHQMLAAEQGNARALLALQVFISETRRHLGGLLVELGGADLIAFTGGIGENGVNVRSQVCSGLEELGVKLDAEANQSARGEAKISAADSRVEVWTVPTNEELIVARQTRQLLEGDS